MVGGQGQVLESHKYCSIIFLADFRIFIKYQGARNHAGERFMRISDLENHSLRRPRILYSLRLSSTQSSTVRITSLGAKHIESPWLSHSMVRSLNYSLK